MVVCSSYGDRLRAVVVRIVDVGGTRREQGLVILMVVMIKTLLPK